MRRFGFFILALGLLLPVLPAEELGFRGKPYKAHIPDGFTSRPDALLSGTKLARDTKFLAGYRDGQPFNDRDPIIILSFFTADKLVTTPTPMPGKMFMGRQPFVDIETVEAFELDWKGGVNAFQGTAEIETSWDNSVVSMVTYAAVIPFQSGGLWVVTATTHENKAQGLALLKSTCASLDAPRMAVFVPPAKALKTPTDAPSDLGIILSLIGFAAFVGLLLVINRVSKKKKSDAQLGHQQGYTTAQAPMSPPNAQPSVYDNPVPQTRNQAPWES